MAADAELALTVSRDILEWDLVPALRVPAPEAAP